MYKGVVTGIAFEASQTNAEATADLGNLTTLMEDGALAAVVSWLIPDRANAPADLKIEQIGFRTKEGGLHAEVSFKDVAGVGVELKHVQELYLPDAVKGWLTKKVFSSNLGIVMFVQYSNGTTRYPASGTTSLLIAIDNQPSQPWIGNPGNPKQRITDALMDNPALPTIQRRIRIPSIGVEGDVSPFFQALSDLTAEDV